MVCVRRQPLIFAYPILEFSDNLCVGNLKRKKNNSGYLLFEESNCLSLNDVCYGLCNDTRGLF